MTIKIFLGNLSSDTTSDQIRPLFEKYGEVVECDVLKNFGFVHMINKKEANEAIAQMDGYSVDGKNIRVELSTGKKGGGGGGGKSDRRGFGGGGRSRPYGPPSRGRDYGGRDYGYPPMPPMPYDRYDPYYRYYMEREAFYARASLDRDPYPRIPDPRDRLPPRPYMDDRALPPADPYFRERDTLSARPPPEYYDRKLPGVAGRGLESAGAAAAGNRLNPPGIDGGDYYRGMDRLGANLGGAAGGSSNGGFFRQGGGGGQMGMGRGMGGGAGGVKQDRQSSFATDPIFF